MAQYLRRPLLSGVGLSRFVERRCFSQIAPRWEASGMRGMEGARPAQQADRSIRLAAKGDMVLQSDIGLLESANCPIHPQRHTHH